MDQHTFDRLTRAVAASQDRRVFLRRLLGLGAAVTVTGGLVDRAAAAPIANVGTPSSTVPLNEPSEPVLPRESVPEPTEQAAEICVEPLVSSDCGCLDPATQTCCEDDVCTGVCTAKDGCCDVSTDKTNAKRGEVCGDHCCHPHLDVSHANYSECCDNSCCAGHCYGENLCCPVDRFCPGADSDLCCGEGERCCGADTADNVCIPGGDGSCCGIEDCSADTDACYVSCEAGFCRQHVCDDGAVCCPDGSGSVSCLTGNCCSDADCASGEACLSGACTAVECFADGDCTGGDACSVATCQDGACSYAPLCAGECATCTDGVCSTDDTICGLCGVCDAGTCSPVVCPDGYTCYDATGECLGIA